MVNVSGHRLSTAEIEAALIEHPAVAESAVVGVADELTGQAVNAFVAIKDGNEVTDALRKEFILQVRKSIGPFAAPRPCTSCRICPRHVAVRSCGVS